MTDHLPECDKVWNSDFSDEPCGICAALRACTLRVRTEPFDVAYLAGLDAAEAAVAALVQKKEWVFSDSSKNLLHQAVLSIRALKEKP